MKKQVKSLCITLLFASNTFFAMQKQYSYSQLLTRGHQHPATTIAKLIHTYNPEFISLENIDQAEDNLLHLQAQKEIERYRGGPAFLDLPDDVILHEIFEYLNSFQTVLSVKLTNKYLRAAIDAKFETINGNYLKEPSPFEFLFSRHKSTINQKHLVNILSKLSNSEKRFFIKIDPIFYPSLPYDYPKLQLIDDQEQALATVLQQDLLTEVRIPETQINAARITINALLASEIFLAIYILKNIISHCYIPILKALISSNFVHKDFQKKIIKIMRSRKARKAINLTSIATLLTLLMIEIKTKFDKPLPNSADMRNYIQTLEQEDFEHDEEEEEEN